MVIEAIVMILVDILLLWLAWWCWRRPQRSTIARWLRLQAFPIVALVILGFVAFADRENRYSEALGRISGQAMVLYIGLTGAVTAMRSKSGLP